MKFLRFAAGSAAFALASLLNVPAQAAVVVLQVPAAQATIAVQSAAPVRPPKPPPSRS